MLCCAIPDTCGAVSIEVFSTWLITQTFQRNLFTIDLTVHGWTTREIREALTIIIIKALLFTTLQVDIFRVRLYIVIVATFFVNIRHIKTSFKVRLCSKYTNKTSLFNITKTRLFKYIENFTSKNWKFSDENPWYFSYFCSKHRLWYSLEPPRRGSSNESPQSMFLSRNKKNNVYPYKPQFYYIKVGFKGVRIIEACFHDEEYV